MGFFDDLVKNLDKSLEAIENGALEDKLSKFADAVDKTTKKAEDTITKASDKPAELLKTAENKSQELENKVKDVGQTTRKSIDIIQG